MISPLNVATGGYLSSTLSLVADGYIGVIVNTGGGGGSGKGTHKGRYDMATLLRDDNDLLEMISVIAPRLLH